MTTTVIVKAHCAPEKEVHIDVIGDPCAPKFEPFKVVLQDGETHELVVYDNKAVTVSEAIKKYLTKE